MAMNPYDANLHNTAARVGAWVRGMVRLYRQPLLAIAAAGAVMALGVSAARAPAQAHSAGQIDAGAVITAAR